MTKAHASAAATGRCAERPHKGRAVPAAPSPERGTEDAASSREEEMGTERAACSALRVPIAPASLLGEKLQSY